MCGYHSICHLRQLGLGRVSGNTNMAAVRNYNFKIAHICQIPINIIIFINSVQEHGNCTKCSAGKITVTAQTQTLFLVVKPRFRSTIVLVL